MWNSNQKTYIGAWFYSWAHSQILRAIFLILKSILFSLVLAMEGLWHQPGDWGSQKVLCKGESKKEGRPGQQGVYQPCSRAASIYFCPLDSQLRVVQITATSSVDVEAPNTQPLRSARSRQAQASSPTKSCVTSDKSAARTQHKTQAWERGALPLELSQLILPLGSGNNATM